MEATEAMWQSTRIGLPGRVSASAAREIATGSIRVVLGPRPQWVAEGRGDEEVMGDMDEEVEAAGAARDVTMAETETASRTATETETETETGALATNDHRDPAHLRMVIGVDHCGAVDGS